MRRGVGKGGLRKKERRPALERKGLSTQNHLLEKSKGQASPQNSKNCTTPLSGRGGKKILGRKKKRGWGETPLAEKSNEYCVCAAGKEKGSKSGKRRGIKLPILKRFQPE